MERAVLSGRVLVCYMLGLQFISPQTKVVYIGGRSKIAYTTFLSSLTLSGIEMNYDRDSSRMEWIGML